MTSICFYTPHYSTYFVGGMKGMIPGEGSNALLDKAADAIRKRESGTGGVQGVESRRA